MNFHMNRAAGCAVSVKGYLEKTRKTKYFGDVELTIDDFYCNAELRAELNWGRND
ncbi:hypothetical protein FACS1894151_00770 [Spirochaetia bacterium]|nr:hypothetical protein FACS1894151_00770 [Spirochaetia bacterium]